MTDLREAAQAVLDRWDKQWDWLDAGPTADLMKDLRAALAESNQEPVAWLYTDAKGRPAMVFTKKAPYEDAVPLYTAPPQRTPLTDEEIKYCEKQSMINGALPFEQRVLFARAIERAHGIGGEYER